MIRVLKIRIFKEVKMGKSFWSNGTGCSNTWRWSTNDSKMGSLLLNNGRKLAEAYVANSNTLVTWCKELTHLKRPWRWEWLKAGRKGDDKGWDGWMASLTQWSWVWVNSGNMSWTGRPGVLQSMGSQRVRHNWVTELN